MTIYELTGRMAALQDALAGEIDPEEESDILAEMEITAEDIEDKLDGYARIMRNLTAESNALKAEADRLRARKTAIDNHIEWIKSNVQSAMCAAGMAKAKTSIGAWGIQKNPHSVIVTDESEIPEVYRIPQPDKIDSRAIIAAYKQDGEIVPGTQVIQTEGLRFR
jgi:hypothetical protein